MPRIRRNKSSFPDSFLKGRNVARSIVYQNSVLYDREKEGIETALKLVSMKDER